MTISPFLATLAGIAAAGGINAAQTMQINGAGATFPFLIYTEWAYGDGTTHEDAFFLKLDPSGNIAYLSYLGGDRSDYGEGIAVGIHRLQKYGPRFRGNIGMHPQRIECGDFEW